MKLLRHPILVFALVPAMTVFACAAEEQATKSQDEAISESVSMETACAVHNAYVHTPLSGFERIAVSDLPPGVVPRTTAPTTVAKLGVYGVGVTYLIEEGSTTTFYDSHAAVVARFTVLSTETRWYSASYRPLSCLSGSDASVPPNPGADAGIP